MQKKIQKEEQTQKKTSVFLAEVGKEVIKPIDLLQEIEPLLREYFVGDFQIVDNAIIMRFVNGQKFRLIAEEITQPTA